MAEEATDRLSRLVPAPAPSRSPLSPSLVSLSLASLELWPLTARRRDGRDGAMVGRERTITDQVMAGVGLHSPDKDGPRGLAISEPVGRRGEGRER